MNHLAVQDAQDLGTADSAALSCPVHVVSLLHHYDHKELLLAFAERLQHEEVETQFHAPLKAN